jgi:TPP-dependent trihydroxycyclohexane-1,2-dione (THcHDO) dehydratase
MHAAAGDDQRRFGADQCGRSIGKLRRIRRRAAHPPAMRSEKVFGIIRVLTDPTDCGPVTLALPQDVQTEAYDPISVVALPHFRLFLNQLR